MLSENRSVIYKTFAKLFYYPDNELAAFLFNGVITEFLNYLGNNIASIENFDEWLADFKNINELVEALQVEFTGLFITNFPTVPAPMFKSYYVEKEILGESTMHIMDTYKKFNFHVSESVKEPADNLALLFEFVYKLTELENTYESQILFINKEILSWIDEFAAKVSSAAMVTGALGILFLNWFGLLDISKIFIPRTFIWGQMLGGAILGAGFGFGGYCPGTSLVSASTGKLDGMAFVFGAFLGTMSFGDIFYNWLKGAYLGGPLGRITLPELFGINAGVFILLIIITLQRQI